MKLYFLMAMMILCNTFAFQIADVHSNQKVDESIEPMLLNTSADIPGSEDLPSSQEQLELIMRTFKKLPAPEIERMGVDINQHVIHGTRQAEILRKAWRQRQIELREATEAIVKPAKHMAQIAQKLQNRTLDDDSITESLIELESFLTDLDNAKDFHTIGGWPILTSLLDQSTSKRIRMHAAWIVGTAIKNNYDYQLWVLEPISIEETSPSPEFSSNEEAPGVTSSSSSTCLQLLVSMLNTSTTTNISTVSPSVPKTEDETRNQSEIMSRVTSPSHDLKGVSTDEEVRKALYAISAAARGNVDVQLAILDTPFLSLLEALVVSTDSSREVLRKSWAFVADMLEERGYIRTKLLNEILDSLPYSESDEYKEKLQGIQGQISQLKLLGDKFCTRSWTDLARGTLVATNDYTRIHFTTIGNFAVINALMNNLITVLKSLSMLCGSKEGETSSNTISPEEFDILFSSLSNASHWMPDESLAGNITNEIEIDMSDDSM